jgi:hypothetical protein
MFTSSLRSTGTLWLDVNSLSGSIPTEIGLVMQLTSLDVMSNSLTGQIPTEIGLMSSLTGLQLFTNFFTGPIASEIGLLSSLCKSYIVSSLLLHVLIFLLDKPFHSLFASLQ